MDSAERPRTRGHSQIASATAASARSVPQRKRSFRIVTSWKAPENPKFPGRVRYPMT